MLGDLVHDMNSEFVIKGALGRNILGTEESVDGITREILVKYFEERYCA